MKNKHTHIITPQKPHTNTPTHTLATLVALSSGYLLEEKNS